MAGDAGGGVLSLDVPPRAHTRAPCASAWGTGQILVVVRVAHARTFQSPDLVVWVVGGRRTFLSGQCQRTLLRSACFKTPTLAAYYVFRDVLDFFFLFWLKFEP